MIKKIKPLRECSETHCLWGEFTKLMLQGFLLFCFSFYLRVRYGLHVTEKSKWFFLLYCVVTNTLFGFSSVYTKVFNTRGTSFTVNKQSRVYDATTGSTSSTQSTVYCLTPTSARSKRGFNRDRMASSVSDITRFESKASGLKWRSV